MDDNQPNIIEYNQDQFDLSDPDIYMMENDVDQSAVDISIIRTAKKNLCFELEYLQTVSQNLDIRASTKFEVFRQQMKELEDNPLKALQSGSVPEETKRAQYNKNQINFVDGNLKKNKDVKLYLEQRYSILIQMKNDYLKTDSGKDRNQIRKALKAMCYHLERTRLYLDDYIYPRDISLNLIDVQIEENDERKRAAHLTERLYCIVQKDFFTAYEKCKELDKKIMQMQGQDLEQESQKIANESRLSVALQNDLEQLTEDQSFIETQSIVSENKTTREVDELRKHLIRNTMGVQRNDGLMKMIKTFSPVLTANLYELDPLLDKEFCLQISIKNINIPDHELQLTLYQENGIPFSLTAGFDTNTFAIGYHKDFIFTGLTLKTLLTYNVGLIINLVEKRKSNQKSWAHRNLNTNDCNNIHKIYKGCTVLPLSKLFWVQQLKHKQIYEVKEAMFYKPGTSFQIEDKYVTMVEKRSFKKYKDAALKTQANLCYNYRMESKIDETTLEKSGSTVINKVNFDQRDLSMNSNVKLYKSKEKYRFNDIKIDLNSIIVSENTMKKSPIFRIEIALRDNFGVVYDTIYKSMCDNQFEFTQTYESLIYSTSEEVSTHESFFVRVPTKSIDTLQKLYLIFMVQSLPVNYRDVKGNKVKQTNFHLEMERLQFKTEIFGIVPLYDKQNKSILKNQQITLNMRQMDEQLFQTLTKFEHFNNFKETDDKLKVYVKVISNEFTYNTVVNDLMITPETSSNPKVYEDIIGFLKTSGAEELVVFHDKILDKLFMIMTSTNSLTIQDLVFETIIQIIQIFQKDYRELLKSYIEKHFAHSKAYAPLLHQIRQTSEIIKEGLPQQNGSAENQNEINVILASLKYLSEILKLMRISFKEEQQCLETQQLHNGDMHSGINQMGIGVENGDSMKHAKTVNVKESYYDMGQKLMANIKGSVIEEEDYEENDDSEEENEFSKNQMRLMDKQVSAKQKQSMARKKAVRNTLRQGEGILGKVELSKREFGMLIQRSLLSIFEGCHKDAMKSTLALRAILYENITEIFEQITEFMDDKFLQQVLIYLYEEQPYQIPPRRAGGQGRKGERSQSRDKSQLKMNKGGEKIQQSKGNMQDNTSSSRTQQSSRNNQRANNKSSQMMNDRESAIIDGYINQNNFIPELQYLNHINEEHITKYKIIAMGNILANGILDKVQGNSNQIVRQFCQNVEQNHLKRAEMNIHVFFFLHQLFVYLKSNPDNDLELKNHHSVKLKIFSKQSLDLKDFFTKILPDIVDYIKDFYKENDPSRRLKESKCLEEALSPFKEKTALVLLSIVNSTSKDKIKEFIFNEPKKLAMLMSNLKKLTKKITFKEPYHVYFEKKKIQVIRKFNEFIIQIFMETNPETLSNDYHSVINQCRMILIFLWTRLAKIKNDYKKTTRSKTLVKDQMKVHKTRMLHIFKDFWNKYKEVGQNWKWLRHLNKQMQMFIKLGNDRAIKIYMEMVSDILQIEFKSTGDIYDTSNCIFSVFNDLTSFKSRDDVISDKYYLCFEQEISQTEMFKQNEKFRQMVELKFDQMRKLNLAQQNVLISNTKLSGNLYYQVFCLAKLMQVFWELKMFKQFNDNVENFKKKQVQLNNYTEIAFTEMRLLDLIKMNEQDVLQLGQKEIQGLIQIGMMQNIVEHLTKAEMYEKALEVYNQMKDIFENVMHDFDAVSKVLVSMNSNILLQKKQSKIYKTMSQNQNRHFASYFKLGYFGDYPEMIKNQEFIYRGGKLMKRFDILQQIQKHFPDAINLNDVNYPSDEILNSKDRQYLQITPVIPLTFAQLRDFSLDKTTKDIQELELAAKVKDLPEKLLNYHIENFKNKFYRYTVIQSKTEDDLQKDYEIEIFKVKEKFPTIINMQNIIKTKKIILRGLDKANMGVQEHIHNLQSYKKNVVDRVAQESGKDLQMLSSFIAATLSSPIQGGIERYINSFITDVYLQDTTSRPKALLLFQKLEQCAKVINDSIQLIQERTEDEANLSLMQTNYVRFKEKLNEIRCYIDETSKLFQEKK